LFFVVVCLPAACLSLCPPGCLHVCLYACVCACAYIFFCSCLFFVTSRVIFLFHGFPPLSHLANIINGDIFIF
jgi:hypothetical protein